MTDQPGEHVIAGRYRLIAQEGEGGMATVWRAMDEQLEREVAVKILRPQFGADPGFATRFRNEARAAGALSHPNVVQVYDFGTDAESGDQYIVMQLVEGQDLATVLKERGPLEIDEAVAIGAAVADALDAAHRHGLIHRDIKPGNILLTSSGRALVTDFGISRAIADAAMTVTGTTIGSVHYFSPEQAAGEEVGPPSDIYALGIVIYQMLSGRRPFEGDSAAGVALKRLNEPPPPLSTGIHPIPAALEAVVMKALARDPAKRYPDAAAFAQALRTWQSGEETATMVAPAAVAAVAVTPPPLTPEPVPETAPAPPYIPPGPPPKKQQPWWIWVLAFLAVILLGAMGFLGAELLGGREEPSPSAQTFALPNWEGDPITQVRQEAIDRGLVLDEQPDFSEDVPEDSVIRTEPEAGAQVSEGDTITVFVSSGQETVEVPILVGQTRNEANITLTQADLRLGAVDDEFSDRPEGTVIRSSPAAGIEVDVGSQVDIVLSRGPEPTPTPPPTPPPTPTPPPPPTPTPAPTPTP
jgi:eukaryotic-like serine/threonine-protein kinase